MPSYRYPVLVWHHPGGGCTACLVENPRNVAAVAENAADAVGQLKELLQWQLKKFDAIAQSDFESPSLQWIKAEIRPEYQSEGRIFSVNRAVTLRVPCVLGKDRSGLRVCAAPTLGVRFTYDEDADLPHLAAHHIQVMLKGMTPGQLARHLPPPSVALEDVSILAPRDSAWREPAIDLQSLPEVAEPIGDRDSRRRLSRPWQRDAEVARLADTLVREKSSLLLLGESGVGKSAILAEAVRKAERHSDTESDDESPRLRHRFWLTSAGRLIAGMKYLGQWQERIEEIIETLSNFEGVLCVDNLLDLVRTGGVSPNDSVAAFLIPYLQRGQVRLIGEASPAELDACRRLLPAFAAQLVIVDIPPFAPSQAVAALSQLADVAKQNTKVDFTPDAIRQIYRLFARFMPYSRFPGKAAAFTTDLFDRASRSQHPCVDSQAVIGRFIQLTGLPELFLRDEMPLKLEEVARALNDRVIGQENACRAVARVITTFKAGLNDPRRPLAVLLFCGPTGVGKTELARTIADQLFGQGNTKDRIVRLDMSEYAGPGAGARLIGSPDGEPSELIKRLREQPFTVVLLDEIEKAAADVFDMLLGVFDEGRLTDRYGRLTTFRSALIIMTSNLGAEAMEPFGLSRTPASDYDAEAMSFFRPEFFNRIDAVVTFSPLSAQTIRTITVSELQRIAGREGLQSKGMALEWTEAVVGLLCAAGYDRRYGARPLQRAIEARVVTPLARFLIARTPASGATVAMDVAAGEEIVFEVR